MTVRQADDGARDGTWGVARGPDATVKGPRAPVECPRCGDVVPAGEVAAHGDAHVRADVQAGAVSGGPPLAARQVADTVHAGGMYPWGRA